MRFKCIISYDGSKFHGFQRQKNAISVQEKIETVLSFILKENVSIVASGRTDAFVHAIGQVIHFDTVRNITPMGLKSIMNKRLSPFIVVRNCCVVNENFSARFDCVSKEYHYYIYTGQEMPMYANYAFYYQGRLDFRLIDEAIKLFLGQHDFKGFSKKNDKINTIRTIYNFTYEKKENFLVFKIKADGFLYNMVRIIMATLIRISEKRIPLSIINEVFDTKSRSLIPYTLSPNGLYLYSVDYKE